jgi:hypothetical protein
MNDLSMNQIAPMEMQFKNKNHSNKNLQNTIYKKVQNCAKIFYLMDSFTEFIEKFF